MPVISTNMGLTVWTAGSDPYSHLQLAENFDLIDVHDHVPSDDGGVQIGTGGIAAGAITTSQLASGAVTDVNIAAGTITVDKFDPSVLASIVPLGSIIPWYRPNNLTALPTGTFVVCAGQSLTSGQHNFAGGGTITVPNLVHNFVYGSAADGSEIGATGGSNTANLSHSHTVNSHQHTVDPHSHPGNPHSHTVSAHNHTITPDGQHNHGYDGGGVMHTRTNAFDALLTLLDGNGSTTHLGNLQSLYVVGDAPSPGNDKAVAMDTLGAHSHGGGTGGSAPGTDAQAPGTGGVGVTTNTSAPGTSSALGSSTDIRPSFVGLLYIIRVKNA